MWIPQEFQRPLDTYSDVNSLELHLLRLVFWCRYLDPDYRRPLILHELLGFHADIICLQEMDEKAFTEYFLPQLQQAGRATPLSCHACYHSCPHCTAQMLSINWQGNARGSLCRERTHNSLLMVHLYFWQPSILLPKAVAFCFLFCVCMSSNHLPCTPSHAQPQGLSARLSSPTIGVTAAVLSQMFARAAVASKPLIMQALMGTTQTKPALQGKGKPPCFEPAASS